MINTKTRGKKMNTESNNLERAKMNQPIFDQTKYPALFHKTFPGCSTITPELVKNRNDFVEDFEIIKPHAVDVEIYCRFFHNHQCYKTRTGKVVFIYNSFGNRPMPDGFEQRPDLYGYNAKTFVQVFPTEFHLNNYFRVWTEKLETRYKHWKYIDCEFTRIQVSDSLEEEIEDLQRKVRMGFVDWEWRSGESLIGEYISSKANQGRGVGLQILIRNERYELVRAFVPDGAIASIATQGGEPGDTIALTKYHNGYSLIVGDQPNY